MADFPVEKVIPALADSLSRNRSVVLKAPPGSGKTTCVPPALLDAPWLAGKKILMLEPRRLAARSAAKYISRKLGDAVGGVVGFSVRLERKVSSRTRLEIVTEGLLVQRLLSDPELSDVGLVIFDEFHERSLPCDLGYAMTLDVRRALRPDLRMLVMSATLDADPIAAHLGDADVHTAEARMFPVETRHLQISSTAPVFAQMAGAVRRLRPEMSGTILCFLPGEGEIRRCQEELRDLRDVYPLFGAMDKDEQDDAIADNGRAKVILATSIAETSLTIPGVTAVIDSGLMRVSRFSPSSGMSRLETLRLTRDRADQRRGRAGRLGPGLCLRLWTEVEDRLLLPSMKPEILETDLAGVVLSAASWGTVRRDGLPWLTPPPAGTWDGAVSLLKQLGALDADGRLTERGRSMARFPAHPRLANMMLADPAAAKWAAILEEGARLRETDLTQVRPTPRMRELARRWGVRPDDNPDPALLAYAFPDRIAKNRGNGSFTMTSGRGAFLERTDPLAACEYLVLCELDDRGGDAKVQLAAPISEGQIEDMFADEIREDAVTEWDRRGECVKTVKLRHLGKMPIRAGGQSEPDPDAVREALFAGIRQKGVANLPCWTRGARALQARISFLARVVGEPWPDVSDDAIAAHLETWAADRVYGMSRWAHLEKLDLCGVLDAALGEAGLDRRTLDRLAPTSMPVPSGSEMTIHYDETEPYVEVRLQECFGLYETPKVAGGRAPVLMKLLSPAQRPVQITKDLANFWREGYPLVRKDLRGRYPKHYWPEDPFTAVATRRVRPR